MKELSKRNRSLFAIFYPKIINNPVLKIQIPVRRVLLVFKKKIRSEVTKF